jgi:PTH2 family peptidyl-tRNA hydrolase
MTKQVIVIRKDLNMRKGKMIAQGAHASLNAFLSRSWVDVDPKRILTPLGGAAEEWFQGMHTKITVYVESEQELLAIYEKAKSMYLPHYLVKDAGLTEFKEPTYTALAIGPDESDKIDKVTGRLPLL